VRLSGGLTLVRRLSGRAFRELQQELPEVQGRE
jgi:hypothetical protein